LQKLLDKNHIGTVVLAYNRPSHLKRLLISLQRSNIHKISLYLDKPTDQLSNVNQKEILRQIKAAVWLKCNVIKLKKHSGVSKSVKFALDNEFRIYDKIIFLEDDCIPFKFFFQYMINCLNKFENNNKIRTVCGYQLPFLNKRRKIVKNIFIKRFIPWGWATWKDRWVEYNESLMNIKKTIYKSKKKIYLPKEINNYLKNKRLLNNSEDVWSINWACLHYLTNSLCVYPNVSLIRNIGFDGSGVHCLFSSSFTVNNYEKYIRRVNISNKFLENKVNEKKFENYMLKNFSKTILKPNKINSKKKTAWHQ